MDALFGRVLLVLSLVGLAGCPATIRFSLENQSDEKVQILYAAGRRDDVAPGQIVEGRYDFDCIKLAVGGRERMFREIEPPRSYFKTGGWSPVLRLVYTDSGGVVLYPATGNEGGIKLPEGCS